MHNAPGQCSHWEAAFIGRARRDRTRLADLEGATGFGLGRADALDGADRICRACRCSCSPALSDAGPRDPPERPAALLRANEGRATRHRPNAIEWLLLRPGRPTATYADVSR